MAEVVGIIASAIAFAQATVAVLDGMNKIKDAPKNIQELRYELQDLEAVLRQIDSIFSCQKGDPTEPVLRSCSDTLKQLHDLVAPFRQEVEDNKIKQYVKGLRIRPKESEIESAVKRLQSQKLTLTLALLASLSRSDSLLPFLIRY
jgi:N-terminal domain on NACHT_NTPase and P-loop NTPases